MTALDILAGVKDMATLEKIINDLPDKEKENLISLPLIQSRLGAKATLTEKQRFAEQLLRSAATHCMLFGGARSGKTFLIVREIVTRALMQPSRHAILRFRFNHVVTSVALDTLPKVMDLCFPNAKGKMDRGLWYYKFPNGSEIWFGGLDEKERTEKILGQEYATIYLNECSQISWESRQMALTRLAQNVGLPLKMFNDCNPPSKRHWTHSVFIDKIDPVRHQPLKGPDNYVSLLVNPIDNMPNLPPGYIDELENLDSKKRNRFLLGVFADEDDTALWTEAMLDKGRVLDGVLPDMQRVVVAVDPSGCSGPEDLRSDEIGIIVCGIGTDGRGYVLEDLSGRFGPEKWKTVVAGAYHRHQADAVVAETNFGGAMVKEVMRTAEVDGRTIPFREVKASRGKVVRAEPISALFEQNKISLVGRFDDLEYQLLAFTMGGYMGDKSPDRADAMVWGFTSLFPGISREKKARTGSARVNLGYSGVKPRHSKRRV